jgi:Reverse transcriptase (RNA-dependent DNA polymerase)
MAIFENPVALSAIQSEPRTYRQSQSLPDAKQWQEAAEDELKAHAENGTWEIVKLPPGQKAIGSRWFMKIKRLADGSIDRYRARLVAKGYSQRPGFDYLETFAPTVRVAAIRTILAIAAIEDLELRSIDISHSLMENWKRTSIWSSQKDLKLEDLVMFAS